MAIHQSRHILTAIAAFLVVVATATVSSSSAFAEDDPDGIGLTVTVTSSAATPSPSATATSTTPGSTNGGSGGSGTVDAGTDLPADEPAPRPGEADIGGVLYVSGLSAEGRGSLNPLATDAHLQFTVRNVSDTVISGSAAFRVHNLFGWQLGSTRAVTFADLEPNETRVVQATISNVGQWVPLHASVLITPPKEVEGTALSAFSRDQYFVVFPWFLVVLAVIAVAGVAITLLLRRAVSAASVAAPLRSPA